MGYAVGFMNVSKAIDLELLNSQFDLGVYHGLRKPDENDKITSNINLDQEESPVCFPEKINPFVDM